MELSVFQYLVPLLLLPLSLCAAVVFLRKSDPESLNHPPGTSGWPIVGENINLAMQGSENFIRDRMKRYCPQVFQTCLLGEKMAIFCGPEGNKFLFSKQNKLVTSWLPEFIQKILLLPEDYDHHREISLRVHSFATDSFKPEALKQLIPAMDSMARQYIGRDWVPREQVQVVPASRKYVFDLSCKLFLGVEDPARISILSGPFHLVVKGVFSVPFDFPGTAYRRSLKGGSVFRSELLRIIGDRRKEGSMMMSGRRDLLSKTLLEREDASDKEIMLLMMGLLVPAYDTTATLITFVLKHLAELPHIYDKVFQEVTAIAKTKGPDELLTWEDCEKMKYSWNVARESLRVASPTMGIFGEALTDFIFAGFTIPKGWKTFWNVYTTHKDPKYFPEPEKIDPSRYEGRGPIPYTFVPFGGGFRMCPGREYARLAVLVFIYNVVVRFKLEMVIPNEKITYHSFPTPVKGLPLHLQPHAS